jgi:hypothetical protein
MSNPVTPNHYKKGGVQVVDFLRLFLTAEEFRGWVKGDAIAYIARERDKGGDQDIAKAEKTLSFLGVGEQPVMVKLELKDGTIAHVPMDSVEDFIIAYRNRDINDI